MLVVSLGILLLSAAATRWNFQRGFLDYVSEQESERLADLSAELEKVYERDGGWERLRREPGLWFDLQRSTDRGRPPPRPLPEQGLPPPGGPGGKPPPRDPLDLGRRISLLDSSGTLVAGRRNPDSAGSGITIEVDGQNVGTLWLARPKVLENPLDREFAAQQDRTIYIIAAVALLLAAMISALLARQLSRPIRELSERTRVLAKGDFETRIDTDRNDELSKLAGDFNELARTLQENRDARRRWVTDIAHELRTPLAIMRGELEAVADGVREFDKGTISSLQAEISRLSRLIADLRELSESDRGSLEYRRTPLELGRLVSDVLAKVEKRIAARGLTLTFGPAERELAVLGDAGRLEQLLSNLIENSLRYTDAPGTLSVSIEVSGDNVRLTVADSAPGVPDEALPHLFERLYRVDESRNRATGGSGLGLSICKAIVTAHDGRIEADHSEYGGLAISVVLPLMPPGSAAS